MSIKGLICRSCLRVTPLDASHWDNGECAEPTIDPGILQAAVTRQIAREERIKAFRAAHPGEIWFEVSELLGGVRDVFLRRNMDYWPDAQSFNSTEFGDAVGARCEEGLRSLEWETQTQVQGKLFGVNVFGHIDAHKKDWSRIRDTKVKSQGSFFYQQGRGFMASNEDAAQVNAYRILATQMGLIGMGESSLEIWYGAMLAANDAKTKKPLDSWMKARAPLMSEEQIGALKSGGSMTTVRENAAILLSAQGRVDVGEDPRAVEGSVPMSCKEMFGKQKCSSYCNVVYNCYSLAGLDVRVTGKPKVRIPDATM